MRAITTPPPPVGKYPAKRRRVTWSQAACAGTILLACYLLGPSCPTSRAWDLDIIVSTVTDSVDAVALVADPCVIDHLYALLAKVDSVRTTRPSEDEIAVSHDGGANWSNLAFHPAPSLGRGGIDMALGESTLCVAETRCDSSSCALVTSSYSPVTGDHLCAAVVLDNLIGVGDVSLCSDQMVGVTATSLYLAAVVDQGSGPLLYFARSLDDGLTWQDGAQLADGNLEWIDLAATPEVGGRIFLAYICGNEVHLALNLDCGHSEYWAEVYSVTGPAAEGSRPAVAVHAPVALLAVEIPEGDIAYCRSLDTGMTWYPWSCLVGTAHHETAPLLSADGCGVFHFLYTDVTEANLLHRASTALEPPGFWGDPQIVSDEAIWVAPEATDLDALADPGGGSGALFVHAGERITYFDAERPAAALEADTRRPSVGNSKLEATFTLQLAGQNPTRGPVDLLVRMGGHGNRAAEPNATGARTDPSGSPSATGTVASLSGHMDQGTGVRLEILDPAGR
ncbi:MAG: hypothetical protein KAY24_19605, partial [Candidatus Eisenbacteria sp.]|nr:hypothetical protein [Candidatus Eisenbacteria bacterium]